MGFRSYGKRFGFDIAYHDARNFTGWREVDGVRHDFTTSEDMFRLRTLNINGSPASTSASDYSCNHSLTVLAPTLKTWRVAAVRGRMISEPSEVTVRSRIPFRS